MEKSTFANAMPVVGEPRVYVDMMTDFGFKRIFGDEALLRAFLNALFEREGKVVEELEYLNTEMVQEFKGERLVAYDVHCRTEKGEEFIVEMQCYRQSTYGDRCLYYMSRAVVRQGEKGKAFKYRLKPVYGVFLTDFHVRRLPKGQAVSRVLLKEEDMNEVFMEKFKLFFIDLRSFKKRDEEECQSFLDKWIYNIKYMGTRTETPKMAAESNIFAHLYTLAEVAGLSEKELAQYEYSLKLQWDRNMDEYTRKVEKEEAVAEAVAEAKAKALEEGRKEGHKAGRESERIAIAKNFKQNGASVELIAASTGLSAEVIESL